MKKIIMLLVAALVAGTVLAAQSKNDSYEQYSFTLACQGTSLATVHGNHVVRLFRLLPVDVREEIYREMRRCCDSASGSSGTLRYDGGVEVRYRNGETVICCEGYSISANAGLSTILEVMRQTK